MFSNNFWHRYLVVIYAMAVFILAFFSFFWNYNYPNSSQWDEVYHISSAEKYLTGSLFMESHPPLGKMFIALGEKILQPNAPKDQVSFLGKMCFGKDDWQNRPETIDKSGFLKVDQIQSYPTGFSFCGFRLMPVIFATLAAPLFFFLLFLLVRNAHLAAIFSSLYLFDNAIILQSRSAMVDSIQIFFIILALTYFVWQIEKITGFLPRELQFFSKNKNLGASSKADDTSAQLANQLVLKKLTWQKYATLGLLCGLSIATKHNAAIILVLPVAWFIFELYTGRIDFKLDKILNQFSNNKTKNSLKADATKQNPTKQDWLQAGIKIVSFSLGLVIMYTSVLAIHVSVGTTVISDNNNRNGFYLTSDTYKQTIAQNGAKNPLNWPVMIYDNWKYMQQYHAGVPKLDLCKRDDAGNLSENGSYPMTWPVMNRTISFRWEWGTKDGTAAKDNTYVRYSYLIGNPLIWAIGLTAILLALVLILGFLFFNLPIKNRRVFNYILVLTALYLAYMIGVMSVERVMYLYHYLIPLLFTLILAPLLFVYSFGNLEEVLENSSPVKTLDTQGNDLVNSDQDFQPAQTRADRILEHKETSSLENAVETTDETANNLAENSIETAKYQETTSQKVSSDYIFDTDKNQQSKKTPEYFWHWVALCCGLLLVFACFAFFSPFTYYQPLSRAEFMARNWFSFWQMRVVN